MPGINWQELDRYGRARHGLVRRRDAGLTRDQVRRARERGQISLPHPGVLRMAGSPATDEQRLLAAVWAAGGLVAASHRSAAALWKLGVDWPDCPEICVRPNRRLTLNNVIVHRSDALVPELISVVHHIAATNPLLTLAQLGANSGPGVVARGLERGLIQRLFTMDGVHMMLANVGRSGRDGAGVLRRVVAQRALGNRRPDGDLEPLLAELFDRYGLPRPAFQHKIRENSTTIARPDFAYPALLIAIEVDGWEVHGTPEATTLDFERQNALERRGWMVMRFTWYDVTCRPDYVAYEIAQALRSRSGK
jgi:very-short-patch-repair endonuclease